jgi:adenylate cyclase
MNLFMFLKMLGFTELKSFPEDAPKYMQYFFGFMAFIIALAIGFLELKLFSKWNRFSVLKFVFYKYGIIIVTIVLGGAAVFLYFILTYQKLSLGAAIKAIPDFLASDIFISVFVFLLLFSIMFNVLKVISEHLGPQAFWAALIGKYNKPLEEDRTFIFLDLKSSTTIAEKIGHAQYSRFINECFQILTKYLYKYDAELYQFVGDEAILSWKTSAARKSLSPLQLYFDFTGHLRKENERLQNDYGANANFKAAIHAGLVAVSKIESTKNEIVYHGDILNTCSRMIEECNRLGKDLIISQNIAEWLAGNHTYKARFVEQLMLRGKEKETQLYEVHKTTEN